MNARDDEAKEGSLGTGKYIFEAATVLFVTVTDIGFIVTCSYLILTSVKAATCSVRVHRELTWQPDDASGECAECAMPFNFLRRRHHCRGCGRLLCGDCSSYKATLLHHSRHARILTPCLAPKAPMPAGAVIEGKPVATQMQRACARCISTRFSLYGAAQAGDAASVKRLGEVQGGLAKCDNSALEQAVISGELQAVQVLVQVGVALNRGNREGVTCLMQAAYCGHEEILKAPSPLMHSCHSMTRGRIVG